MVSINDILKARINTIQENGVPFFMCGSMIELSTLTKNKSTLYPIIFLMSQDLKPERIQSVWTYEMNLHFFICTGANIKNLESKREIDNFKNILRPIYTNLLSCLYKPGDKEIYVGHAEDEPKHTVTELYFPNSKNNLGLECDLIEIDNYKIKIY